MYTTKKIAVLRDAFTLVEMLVVIAIILALAALAAAFAPRVNDSQKMSRAVDNLEQWLLTAKMRAKRDGLATGLRFIQAPGDANIDPSIQSGGPPTVFSQFQYIQQPEPLSGGTCIAPPPPLVPSLLPPAYQYPPMTGSWYTGGLITTAAAGVVNFYPQGVDFWLGNLTPPPYPLVQPGDYLEINGAGVYYIGAVTANTLSLGPINPTPPPLTIPTVYDSTLNITTPTTNYRILRQPRILIGEEPLALPDNYAANFNPIPGSGSLLPGTNVLAGPSGYREILFAPSGAVIGTNAGTPILCISVWDVPQQQELLSKGMPDPNLVGIVGIQSRSGFIGAYSVSLSGNPFYFVQNARESGL
jgi:prepilin-type N-terminal cleavage/methylation domain-containing protein